VWRLFHVFSMTYARRLAKMFPSDDKCRLLASAPHQTRVMSFPLGPNVNGISPEGARLKEVSINDSPDLAECITKSF